MLGFNNEFRIWKDENGQWKLSAKGILPSILGVFVIILVAFFGLILAVSELIYRKFFHKDVDSTYKELHEKMMRDGWTKDDQDKLELKRKTDIEEYWKKVRAKNEKIKDTYKFDGYKVFTETFTIDNSHYDQTHSIQTDAGKFLGECGCERIDYNIESPFTAVEVWLFDVETFSSISTGLIVVNPRDLQTHNLLLSKIHSFVIDLSKAQREDTIECKGLFMLVEVVDYKLKEDLHPEDFSQPEQLEYITIRVKVTPR